MQPRVALADARTFARERRRVADLVALTKPRLVVMVLVTTIVGYYVGLTGAPDLRVLFRVAIGTLLAAGGALALNQYREREVDGRMHRTRSRPLPDGRLQPRDALAFGIVLAVAGVVYLATDVNLLAGLVTAATVVIYVFLYTPLKLRTPLCIVVGAVSGALPPVTGWVAARGALDLGGWLLFGIVFLWQLPHTLAIARLYRDDYARAGIRLLPQTESPVVASAVALLIVGPLPGLLGLAGPGYLLVAVLLGAAFVVIAARQALRPSATAARQVLFASLLYLPLLFTVLALDKR